MDLRQNTTTVEYHLASYPKNDLSSYLREGLFDSASGQASVVSEFHALVGAAFSAQDIGLLQANGSSSDFSKTVQRAGGVSEAVRLLHMLPEYQEETRNWVEVPLNMIPEYSSMIGVPVRGFPSTKAANTSFMIQTNYQTLKVREPTADNCQFLANGRKCAGPWFNTTAWKNDKSNNDSLIIQSTATTLMGVVGLPNIRLDVINDTLRDASTGVYKGSSSLELAGYVEPQKPMAIVFYTWKNLTICTMATEYVDSMIECSRATQNEDLACSVRKMRRTADKPLRGNLTALDIGRSRYVLGHVPYIIPAIHASEPSMLEKWLYDPSTVLDDTLRTLYGQLGPGSVYENIPLEVFSNRLAMALNTNLLAMFNMSIIVGGDATQDVQWANTTGTWTEFTAPVYSINKTWFALYFVSAIVLLICAITNVVLRSLSHAPDFLGSISALTRDSPFFDVPTPASGLEGTERSRLLQDKWVMIQDVMPEKEVGRIALSDADGMVPLQKTRLYS
jgi:hypothetical protein